MILINGSKAVGNFYGYLMVPDEIYVQQKDISSLIAEIQNLSGSEIGHLFDCSNPQNKDTVLTLKQALDENAIVYFCLQPLAFPAYAETLGKLIINDIKSLIADQLTKETKLKLYTIFDEFSVFASDQIVNLINQGRSAGVHAILATQSLSDILKKGGEPLLGQVLNNCNNYLIQRQNNPDDAEILANVIGTKNQFEVTSQISSVDGASSAGSVKQTRTFTVHPDEIKVLPKGQGYVVNKQNQKVKNLLFRQGLI